MNLGEVDFIKLSNRSRCILLMCHGGKRDIFLRLGCISWHNELNFGERVCAVVQGVLLALNSSYYLPVSVLSLHFVEFFRRGIL